MRIVIIGGAGTLGSAVSEVLTADGHQIVGVSRSSEPAVDLSKPDSPEVALGTLAPFDVVICLGPGTPLRPLAELTPAQLQADFGGKLFGQIEALRIAAGLMTNGVVLLAGGAAPDLRTGLSSDSLSG
ncbi:hypothetical protein EV652_114167 [Kribbella steppae]|uniref:NAD-dependent epimerase/dehydratase domain-containing protein n=1 Tax=Kribbella steppae TaxID=2512223 RepID=A0A4R2H2G3_9ACTN|nr:NAD-dependent epimerase/dehydratase family protein [Kribbella steppae]TCO19187.1 hypothetical protein EV652_114167 [Kribbella steppae]